MYQLFFSAGACSLAVNVVLNELGQECELISASLKEGKNKEAAFLKLNPRGQVPVLVDNGMAITEGGAILTHLCDKHPSNLLPRQGLERAKALEALMFANASLHPAYSRIFWLNRMEIDENAKAQLLEASIKATQNLWDLIEQKLQKQSYLAGSDMTVGDILVTVIAGWNAWINEPFALGPKTLQLIEAVRTRPSYQLAMRNENTLSKKAA
jgi:glutathione S-transferase